MTTHWRWALLGASWAVLAIACGGKAPTPPKPAAVVVAKPAVRRQVVSSVTLTGTVEPERTARLVAQVEGEVELLAVRESDPVRSGQVLVRIDPSRLQASLGEARGDELGVQADLEDARRVLERDRALFKQRGIGKERLEESETKVRRLEAGLVRAQARVTGLAAQLADTDVRAPFDGYVLERRVEMGDVVKSASPLLAIASRQAHVLVQVSEIDLGSLHLHDAVDLMVSGVKGKAVATISRIRPQIDPATRTAAVEVVPATDTLHLLPGMLVRATLTLARKAGVVAAPVDAVLTRPDGSRTLFVVEANTAVQRKVSTGLEGGGWLEVVEGLREDELVVIQGQERLKDGVPVTLKADKGTKAGTAKGQAPAQGGLSGGPAPRGEGGAT